MSDIEITVLSWAGRWGRSLQEAVSDTFAAAAGVRVRHRTHVGLKLPGDLVGALERGQRPPVDVVWCNAAPALRAARAGWCLPLDEDGDTLSACAELHPRARPGGLPGWPIVFPYAVHYVLVYRREAFPGGPPRSWDVLLDPRRRGKIALYPGGNGFYPVAQVMAGGRVEDIPHRMEACWDYLARLAPQLGALDYSIGMASLLAERRLDICFRALPNALGFRDEGQDVGWAAPREGVPDTLDALWIPRGALPAASSAGRAYIRHALSRDVQERWCGLMGALPLHPGAALPAAFGEDSGLPRSADDRSRVLYVSEEIKANHEEDWEARFRALFS
jgi:putative spermidine/putrescine transport system substrate-binding protein